MIEVKRLRKGDYIVHKDKPYRVKSIGSKVIGTHSHSVTKIDLECPLDNSKETITKAPHEKVENLELIRKHGQYIAPLKDNKIQIMSLDNYEIFDADVLSEVTPQIREGCEVTYIEFKGSVIVLEVRE